MKLKRNLSKKLQSCVGTPCTELSLRIERNYTARVLLHCLQRRYLRRRTGPTGLVEALTADAGELDCGRPERPCRAAGNEADLTHF